MRTRDYRIDAPKQIEIRIGMGLPGSGKTTYFHTIAPEHGVVTNEGVYKTTIDLDSIMMKGRGSGFGYVTIGGKLSFEKLFNYATSLSCSDKKRIICIDSLCLTRETVKEYLTGLYKVSQDGFPCPYAGEYHIIIDQWEENRDQCLDNDLLRDRDNKASYTIANAPYEPFSSVEELQSLVDELGLKFASVELVNHKVAVPEEWQIKMERPGKPQDARYMRSESWSLGGTWGSYTGEISTVSPDDPKENEELDKFLEQHAPSITMLQYKRLVKECVELKTEEYNDYYGGTTHEQYWETDMQHVYELLIEFGVWQD